MSGGFQRFTKRFLLDAKNAEESEERAFYTKGLIASIVLTVLAFAEVMLDLFPRVWTLAILVLLGVTQIVVHLRVFLHIDLTRQKREDLQLLLFTILLLSIMAFGTLWVLADLQQRMM